MDDYNFSIAQSEYLEEVLERLNEIARIASRGNYIYRGEPARYEKVSSGLYRQQSQFRGEDFDIETVQEEELSDAKKYTRQTEEFEILTSIQHYGGKTNLIDFTYDFHVAAFFACGSPHEKDGRIVFLEWQQDDSNIRIRKPWTPEHRVIAQKSVFVQPKKGYVEPNEEISIPRELKQPMLDYLRSNHGVRVEEIYKDLFGYIQQQDSTSETPLALIRLTPEQEDLCRRMDELHALDELQAKPSDMFRGALAVLEDENNPDRIAQAAHSLREILYPIMGRQARHSLGARKSLFERYGAVFLEVDFGRIYGRLTALSHHGVTTNKQDSQIFPPSDFDNLMKDFESTMHAALIRPFEVHKGIDLFLSGDLPE